MGNLIEKSKKQKRQLPKQTEVYIRIEYIIKIASKFDKERKI